MFTGRLLLLEWSDGNPKLLKAPNGIGAVPKEQAHDPIPLNGWGGVGPSEQINDPSVAGIAAHPLTDRKRHGSGTADPQEVMNGPIPVHKGHGSNPPLHEVRLLSQEVIRGVGSHCPEVTMRIPGQTWK